MPEATIAGRPASLDDAIAAAAGLLGRGRRPVFGGLDADVASIEATLRLARKLGGAVDHAHAAAALRDLDVMRQAGWIITTPLQARARADVVVLAGPGLEQDWPGFATRLLLDAPPPLAPDRPRRVIRLADPAGDAVDVFGAARAHLRGTPASGAAAECAEALREARYGVVIWSAARLSTLAIAMLCGLIDDLNATTRCAGLPLPQAGNAVGAMQAAAWLTGVPLPLGFPLPGGAAVHDPWRYDAARLAASGEADAGVWVCASSSAPAAWTGTLPLVALVTDGTRFAAEPDVSITIGRPGEDHEYLLFDENVGALVARAATGARGAVSAGSVLTRIGDALAARPC